MSYYLRTLEGVTMGGGYTYDDFNNAISYRRLNLGEDVRTALINELIAVYQNIGIEKYNQIKEYLKANYSRGEPYVAMDYVDSVIEFDAQQEIFRQQRIADEQQRAIVEQHAEQIINEGETMDNVIEARVIDAEPEIGEDVVEINEDEMADTSIQTDPVFVDSLPSFSVIDEDEVSITYEDEAGEVHTVPKAKTSAAPWLLAAAAAVFFLA